MADTTHIIRVTLDEDAPIYRDVEIGSAMSLAKLAESIVRAYGFDMDHAYGFYSGMTQRDLMRKQPKYELFADMGMDDTDAGSVEKTSVATAFPEVGSKLMFLFDYGDEWLFHCEVTGLGEKVPRKRYPKVVGSVGEAPPQYPDFDDEDWGDEDE